MRRRKIGWCLLLIDASDARVRVAEVDADDGTCCFCHVGVLSMICGDGMQKGREVTRRSAASRREDKSSRCLSVHWRRAVHPAKSFFWSCENLPKPTILRSSIVNGALSPRSRTNRRFSISLYTSFGSGSIYATNAPERQDQKCWSRAQIFRTKPSTQHLHVVELVLDLAMMTPGSTVALLPPPMEITLSGGATTSISLPQCRANLMPFSIDYDGPAPVDSFLVKQPASDVVTSSTDDDDGALSSFVSAFRGRAIQSTSLPLPPGFKAQLVSVEQIAPTPSDSAAAGPSLIYEEIDQEKERERKRQRTAPRAPAKQQKFSIDSDDEDDQDGDYALDHLCEPEQHKQPSPEPEPQTAIDSIQAVQDRRPKIRISSIAEVKDNELRIWGPDGPIDRGDDTFFRTVGEWFTVVGPLVSFRTRTITLW